VETNHPGNNHYAKETHPKRIILLDKKKISLRAWKFTLTRGTMKDRGSIELDVNVLKRSNLTYFIDKGISASMTIPTQFSIFKMKFQLNFFNILYQKCCGAFVVAQRKKDLLTLRDNELWCFPAE
jgi:hypothetical protein